MMLHSKEQKKHNQNQLMKTIVYGNATHVPLDPDQIFCCLKPRKMICKKMSFSVREDNSLFQTFDEPLVVKYCVAVSIFQS